MRHRLPLLALLATLVAEAVVLWPPPFGLTDHVVLWVVGHLIAVGASPYDPSAWLQAAAELDAPHLRELTVPHAGRGVWPYPPWTGLLFVPFGLLPVEIGTWALHVSYIAVGIAAAIALAQLFEWPSEAALARALVLFAAFQPFVIAARWGQFSAFVLVGVVLAFVGLRTHRAPLLAVAAILLAAKPHVTGLFALVVLVLLITDRAWRTTAAAAAGFGAIAAFAWLRYPEWLSASVPGIGDRLAALGRFASTWSLARALGGDHWLLLGAALELIVLGAGVLTVLWMPRASRRLAFLCVGLVLTSSLTPYIFSYDHLVLAPVAFVSLLAAQTATGAPRFAHESAVVAVVAVLPWAAFIYGVTQPTQAASGLVPILFGLLLLSSAILYRARVPSPQWS